MTYLIIFIFIDIICYALAGESRTKVPWYIRAIPGSGIYCRFRPMDEIEKKESIN